MSDTLEFKEGPFADILKLFEHCTYESVARAIKREAQAQFKEWLERQPVVECYRLNESGLTDQHGPGWTAAEPSTGLCRPDSTHTARLVCIEPIKKDTHESLLREWFDMIKSAHALPPDLVTRTERVLKYNDDN